MGDQKITNKFRKIYEMGQFKNPFSYDLASFPYILDLEATNCCNLDCVMCWRQIMKRKQGVMPFAMFKKIADEAAKEGCKGIRLIRFGEPLLNKNIFEMIKYAKSKGLLVHMTTNGLLLNDQKIKNILDSKLDSIIFSFQGTNKQEYEKIRNNKNYDLLESNVKKLAELRKKLALDHPHIQVTTTILDETEEQIKEFYSKWSKIADNVDHWYTAFLGLENVERIKPLMERQKISKHLQEREKMRGFRCTEVMTKLSIDWNGDVTACCQDFNSALSVGNLNKNTLKEIWNGEKMSILRHVLSQEGGRAKIPFCSKLCTSKF